MKKRWIILIIVGMLMFTGCTPEMYIFRKSTDEIAYIEIVTAKTSLDYSVKKKLSRPEMVNFVEEFQQLRFNTYSIGDPMSVHGESVKITYQSGDYEMICFSWSEYVRDGEIYYIKRNCDQKAFEDLLRRFSEQKEAK